MFLIPEGATGKVIGSIGGRLVGHAFTRWWDTHRHRGLRKLLNFDTRDLVFVCPTERAPDQVLLPSTATADFLAVHDIQRALNCLGTGWETKIRHPSAGRGFDRSHNLVSLCGPAGNPITRDVFEYMRLNASGFFFFKKQDDRYVITDGHGLWQSESYSQIDRYHREGLPVLEHKVGDLAIVMKIRNPWNQTKRVLVLAGIRSIGTWGAAYAVAHHWKELFAKCPGLGENDFSAIVEVNYQNFTLQEVRVLDVKLVKYRTS